MAESEYQRIIERLRKRGQTATAKGHREKTVTLDEAVEAIRVASFEGPKAGSHTEWARRIKEILAALIDGSSPSQSPP